MYKPLVNGKYFAPAKYTNLNDFIEELTAIYPNEQYIDLVNCVTGEMVFGKVIDTEYVPNNYFKVNLLVYIGENVSYRIFKYKF